MGFPFPIFLMYPTCLAFIVYQAFVSQLFDSFCEFSMGEFSASWKYIANEKRRKFRAETKISTSRHYNNENVSHYYILNLQ